MEFYVVYQWLSNTVKSESVLLKLVSHLKYACHLSIDQCPQLDSQVTLAATFLAFCFWKINICPEKPVSFYVIFRKWRFHFFLFWLKSQKHKLGIYSLNVTMVFRLKDLSAVFSYWNRFCRWTRLTTFQTAVQVLSLVSPRILILSTSETVLCYLSYNLTW